MSKIDPKDPGQEVIVATPVPKQESPKKHWRFTHNNYLETDPEKWLKFFETMKCEKYAFQEEIAPTTGTPHLQGYFEHPSKIRMSALIKKWPGVHWDRCDFPEEAWEYAHKSDTRKVGGGSWHIPYTEELILVDETKLWHCQQIAYDLLMGPRDDRTINWFVDLKGKSGKTSLMKMMVAKYKFLFITGGKGNDILNHVANKINSKKFNTKALILNFPRCVEGKVSYNSIEQIKDGIFTSGKYEGQDVIVNSPTIVILANWAPDKSKFSDDRWRIYHINENKEAILQVEVE